MTHFNQPSNGYCHPADAKSGAAFLHHHKRPAKMLADFCLAHDHAQDDIVRPELRNNVMLAGKPTRHRS
jgi:hypothetical protein